MKFSVNAFRNINWILKFFYVIFSFYSIIADFFLEISLPTPFFYYMGGCFWSAERMALISLLGMPFLYISYISLFIKKGAWKYVLNSFLEIILVIDCVFALMSIPWDAYRLDFGKYTDQIGCIVLDCFLFAAVAFGIFVDYKMCKMSPVSKGADAPEIPTHVRKTNLALKIFYGGNFFYGIIMIDFFLEAKPPVSFFSYLGKCFLFLDKIPAISLLGMLLLGVAYASLFIKRGVLKYALNSLLEIIIIIDVILTLVFVPGSSYIWALKEIIWDCVFFAAVAFGFYVDHKIISLKKAEKQVDHEKGGGRIR